MNQSQMYARRKVNLLTQILLLFVLLSIGYSKPSKEMPSREGEIISLKCCFIIELVTLSFFSLNFEIFQIVECVFSWN